MQDHGLPGALLSQPRIFVNQKLIITGLVVIIAILIAVIVGIDVLLHIIGRND